MGFFCNNINVKKIYIYIYYFTITGQFLTAGQAGAWWAAVRTEQAPVLVERERAVPHVEVDADDAALAEARLAGHALEAAAVLHAPVVRQAPAVGVAPQLAAERVTERVQHHVLRPHPHHLRTAAQRFFLFFFK